MLTPNKMFSSPAPVTTMPYCRVFCIPDSFSEYATDQWPTMLSFPPRVGDFIQAQSGKTLKIIEVTHALDDAGQPLVSLRLGQDNTSISELP